MESTTPTKKLLDNTYRNVLFYLLLYYINKTKTRIFFSLMRL